MPLVIYYITLYQIIYSTLNKIKLNVQTLLELILLILLECCRYFYNILNNEQRCSFILFYFTSYFYFILLWQCIANKHCSALNSPRNATLLVQCTCGLRQRGNWARMNWLPLIALLICMCCLCSFFMPDSLKELHKSGNAHTRLQNYCWMQFSWHSSPSCSAFMNSTKSAV